MLSRVAYLASHVGWENPDGRTVREAAQRMGLGVVGSLLRSSMQETEYRRVFGAKSQEPVDAILVSDAAENFTRRRLIVELVEKGSAPGNESVARSRRIGWGCGGTRVLASLGVVKATVCRPIHAITQWVGVTTRTSTDPKFLTAVNSSHRCRLAFHTGAEDRRWRIRQSPRC
jgi:hypothetical protein